MRIKTLTTSAVKKEVERKIGRNRKVAVKSPMVAQVLVLVCDKVRRCS